MSGLTWILSNTVESEVSAGSDKPDISKGSKLDSRVLKEAMQLLRVPWTPTFRLLHTFAGIEQVRIDLAMSNRHTECVVPHLSPRYWSHGVR